jgi:hypothetical protein
MTISPTLRILTVSLPPALFHRRAGAAAARRGAPRDAEQVALLAVVSAFP